MQTRAVENRRRRNVEQVKAERIHLRVLTLEKHCDGYIQRLKKDEFECTIEANEAAADCGRGRGRPPLANPRPRHGGARR